MNGSNVTHSMFLFDHIRHHVTNKALMLKRITLTTSFFFRFFFLHGNQLMSGGSVPLSTAVPTSLMMMMILAYMAFCEVSQDQSPGTPAAAGDFGFKVLTASDPAEKTKKLSAELANGRLAMMAIIGMFFHSLGHSAPVLCDAPGRASAFLTSMRY